MIKYIEFGNNICLPNIVEIEITRECNLHCLACNRRCRQYPGNEELTEASLYNFLNDCENSWNNNKFLWHKIRLLGGEPTTSDMLWKAIRALKYLNDRFGCLVEVWTNGFGVSKERIKLIPNWVSIVNTEKITPIIWKHLKCDIAPKDFNIKIELKDECHSKRSFNKLIKINPDLSKICGIAYTNEGYFVCGGGSSIDFIFNLKLGYKTIEDMISDNGKKQYENLCQYCSETEVMQQFIVDNKFDEQNIWESKSWKEKFEQRNKK